MVDFSQYLSIKRQVSSYTQEKLVDELQRFSWKFDKLDSVTLSRWEGGKTIPSKNRQALIFNFFGEMYKYLDDLRNVKIKLPFMMINKRFSTTNFNIDYPYIESNKGFNLHVEKDREKILKTKFFYDFNEMAYHIPFVYRQYKYEINLSSSISLYSFTDNNDFRLGHFIHACYEFNTIFKVLTQDMNNHFNKNNLINVSQIIDLNKNKILLVSSKYTVDLRTTRVMLDITQQFFLKNPDFNLLITRVIYNEMASFYLKLGGVIIGQSQEEYNNGVKIGNKKFRWVYIVISATAILSLNINAGKQQADAEG
ncbi:MAG: hypothetical protein V5788_04935 [Shewanella sp.]